MVSTALRSRERAEANDDGGDVRHFRLGAILMVIRPQHQLGLRDVSFL